MTKYADVGSFIISVMNSAWIYTTRTYTASLASSQYIGASESRGWVYYTTSRQPMDIASAVEDTQGDVILFHIYAS